MLEISKTNLQMVYFQKLENSDFHRFRAKFGFKKRLPLEHFTNILIPKNKTKTVVKTLRMYFIIKSSAFNCQKIQMVQPHDRKTIM